MIALDFFSEHYEAISRNICKCIVDSVRTTRLVCGHYDAIIVSLSESIAVEVYSRSVVNVICRGISVWFLVCLHREQVDSFYQSTSK